MFELQIAASCLPLVVRLCHTCYISVEFKALELNEYIFEYVANLKEHCVVSGENF